MSKIEADIQRGMDEWLKETVYPFVEKKVLYTAELLVKTAAAFRKSEPGAHNFTGNLLNSIVTCVYKDGSALAAFYAADNVSRAIRFKMTAPKHYHFGRDYDGAESTYTPEVKTNEGWGVDDAREFFASFNPGVNAKYVIVVAYPTEYASFVDSLRHTTGFAEEYQYAKQNGWKFLKLPWAKV